MAEQLFHEAVPSVCGAEAVAAPSRNDCPYFGDVHFVHYRWWSFC